MKPEERPRITYVSPEDPLPKTVLIKSIERLTGQKKLERLYEEVYAEHEEGDNWWKACLDQLNIALDYDEEQLAKIPTDGPLVFVANHPYGVLDGLAICYIASLVRGHDFRILINSVLTQDAFVARYSLPIDFAETKEAVHLNIQTKKRAVKFLKSGGAIVIFPAGGISTSRGPFGEVTDLEWKLFAAKLVHLTDATVAPIYFHGRNSRLFQIASQFSLTLRLSLILHEVNNKMGETLHISLGDPLPYADIADIKGRQELTDYLREVVFELGGDDDPAGNIKPPDKVRKKLKQILSSGY